MGFVLGCLGLRAGIMDPNLFWAWLILLGCFVVDATFTVMVRVYRGCAFYKAHRDHAYQHASLRYGSHVRVSLFVGLINGFWLFPLALAAGLGTIHPILALLVAYIPLIVIALYYRSGREFPASPERLP